MEPREPEHTRKQEDLATGLGNHFHAVPGFLHRSLVIGSIDIVRGVARRSVIARELVSKDGVLKYGEGRQIDRAIPRAVPDGASFLNRW